jgi:hypothetical protein
MSISLDLNLLPVARYAGQEYPELLGLHAAEPPRHSARGRGADRLVFYLAMTGNAPLPPGKRDQVLADLAKLYYATPGSVTTALRVVADELNRLLLERNLRITSSGRQGMGLFTQFVLRDQQVYLAMSGPLQAILITSGEARYFRDAEMTDRCLGQGRATPLSFFQTGLQVNDTLILASQPSPAWNTSMLMGVYGQGPESMRRRLFNQAETDLNAVLIQAKPGKGKFYVLRPKPAGRIEPSTPEAEAQTGIKAIQPVRVQTEPEVGPVLVGAESGKESISADLEKASTPALEGSITVAEASSITIQKPLAEGAISEPAITDQVSATHPEPKLSAPRKLIGTIGTPILKIFQGIGKAMRGLFARILPGEVFLSIPTSVMVFTAVAVPVIVVTISSVVYFQLGRAAQYEVLYSRAKDMAARAVSQKELLAQRSDWEATLQFLRQVEAYQVTPETQALRAQALNALDELDLVRRVNYQPAIIGGLPVTVNVTRMVFSENDLYLLDGNSGNVIRAQFTQLGYKVDPTFQCGPGLSGNSDIGPVIDMVSWPTGYTPDAKILALDANGNVLYCAPDSPSAPGQLASPPDLTWGKLAAMALDLGDLYVLDPFSNAVWIYWKSELKQQPQLFFDEQIPFMQDVMDIAVNGNELYLLHADGHLTLCYFGGFEEAKTRCSDPPFVDYRLGREKTPLIPTSPFTQIQSTLPPDPSLFLLEPNSQAIYHFSLRNLAFQRQYLPLPSMKVPANRAATAFFIQASKRYLFLAVGNEVYYTVMP